jgi:hypothetical protein
MGAEQIARAVWRPLGWGEGARVGVLGDSGTGKSHACRRLVEEYLRGCAGVAWIADWARSYQGQQYTDPGELARRPPVASPRVLCFAGDVRNARPIHAEEVARAAWGYALRARNHALLVTDELAESCTGGQWRRGVERIPAAFTMGRKIRLSVLWGAQYPQQVPQAAFDQSQYLLVFRLSGAPLSLLQRRGYIDARVSEVIRRLPGPEAPPKSRGGFVAIQRGAPWDGQVHRF